MIFQSGPHSASSIELATEQDERRDLSIAVNEMVHKVRGIVEELCQNPRPTAELLQEFGLSKTYRMAGNSKTYDFPKALELQALSDPVEALTIDRFSEHFSTRPGARTGDLIDEVRISHLIPFGFQFALGDFDLKANVFPWWGIYGDDIGILPQATSNRRCSGWMRLNLLFERDAAELKPWLVASEIQGASIDLIYRGENPGSTSELSYRRNCLAVAKEIDSILEHAITTRASSSVIETLERHREKAYYLGEQANYTNPWQNPLVPFTHSHRLVLSGALMLLIAKRLDLIDRLGFAVPRHNVGWGETGRGKAVSGLYHQTIGFMRSSNPDLSIIDANRWLATGEQKQVNATSPKADY